MSSFGGFDEEALNAATGVTASPIVIGEEVTDQVQIHPDDRRALEGVADKTPTGVNPPAPVNAPAVPDYLSQHIPAPPPADAAKPDPINWAQQWERAFGQPPAENTEVTQDSFEREAVRRNAYDGFIGQYPALEDWRRIANGEGDATKLLQQDVEGRLKEMKLYTPTLFDEQLSTFIGKDGALTEAGTQRVEEIRKEYEKHVGLIEGNANKQAQEAEEQLVGFFDTMTAQSKDFKPFGISLDEATITDIISDVRSGAADEWLNNHKDQNEAVQKALLLGLVSNPHRLAELIRRVDERGQQYGANKRLASQLN